MPSGRNCGKSADLPTPPPSRQMSGFSCRRERSSVSANERLGEIVSHSIPRGFTAWIERVIASRLSPVAEWTIKTRRPSISEGNTGPRSRPYTK